MYYGSATLQQPTNFSEASQQRSSSPCARRICCFVALPAFISRRGRRRTERERFELSRHLAMPTRLPSVLFQPLRHLSKNCRRKNMRYVTPRPHGCQAGLGADSDNIMEHQNTHFQFSIKDVLTLLITELNDSCIGLVLYEHMLYL